MRSVERGDDYSQRINYVISPFFASMMELQLIGGGAPCTILTVYSVCTVH